MPGYDCDVAVIGGGPGGYVAAIRAAQNGKRTCLIEAEQLGGVCLNEGCIPTKTLLHSASLLRRVREAHRYGIEGVDPGRVGVSMPALQRRRAQVVARLAGGVGALLRGNGVEVVRARARFLDPHTLRAGDRRVTAEHIVIATGSRPAMPRSIALEGERGVITSTEALLLDKLPATVAVIGGGVVGVELAYLLNALGAEVSVIELTGHILPTVDGEISAMAREHMEQGGVRFHLGAKVQTIKDNCVIYEQDGAVHEVEADAVLMAAGRVPNTDGLDLEAAGVAVERGAVITDERLCTSVPGIYAAGDVNGKSMLAHTASHEGVAAVDGILGKRVSMRYDRIPSCIYLDPEIASIGLTEARAREEYAQVKVGSFPIAANGKSLANGETNGVVKVILDARLHEILGVHLYCAHATEMIAGIAVAMGLEATADEVIHAVHPHPTVSEAVPEAFMDAVGRAIHKL